MAHNSCDIFQPRTLREYMLDSLSAAYIVQIGKSKKTLRIDFTLNLSAF